MTLVNRPLCFLGSHPVEFGFLCALTQLRALQQDLSVTAIVTLILDLPEHHRTLNVALLSVWFA